MAVNPLSLAESLRPWRAAGISHFLREVLDEDDGTIADTAPPSRPPALPDSGQDPRLERYIPSELSPAAAPTSRPAPSPPRPCPSTWPEAWQALFARTRPAPVLWTYPELGLDLGGEGSKQRSACLRELIGKLQLSKGSSTFWPLRLDYKDQADSPDSPDSVGSPGCAAQGIARPDAEMFKSGLFLLEPKVVVFIGPESIALAGLNDLGINLHMPFTQQIARAMLFVLLPEFGAMLESPTLADKASVFLRSALARISVV